MKENFMLTFAPPRMKDKRGEGLWWCGWGKLSMAMTLAAMVA